MKKLSKLNKEQEYAKTVIQAYLDDDTDTRPFITIVGPGGSGKTFMLKDALEKYKPHKIVGSTVSHFAKTILSDSLQRNITVKTIAALLGFMVDYDENGGVTMRKTGHSILHRYSILVIDEVSMIGDELFETILTTAATIKHFKIIAVGDKHQLPPVDQDHDSSFFDTIDAELVKVVRFTGLIKTLSDVYVREIRSYNEGYTINKNVLSTDFNRTSNLDEFGAGYVFVDSLKELILLAYHDFKQSDTALDGCRIIAYKNKTLDYLNKTMRRLLYGKDARRFEIGELLILQGSYYGPTDIKSTRLNNGDTFKVTGVKDVFDNYNIACHILQVNVSLPFPILVVADEGIQAFEEIAAYKAAEAKASKDWFKYNSFINNYAVFKYSYAVSVHKAQGSSIKNVYILEDEIMKVKPTTAKEKFQSLYVAITRARHRVYIHNKNKKVNNKFININKNKYIYESTENLPE